MARTRLAHQLVSRLRSAASEEVGSTDRELLDRYLACRDEEAFATLVRRHGPAVHAACQQVLPDPADAADAFQLTFLTLFKKASTTVWRDSVGAWLYTVAHRTAVQIRRQAQRRRTHETRASQLQLENTSNLSWQEACGILHEELDRLPDRYRLPLLLCYLEGQSRDEVALTLGWTSGAVRGRLERARQALAARLTRRGVTLSAGLLTMVAANATAGYCPSDLICLALQAINRSDSSAAAVHALGGSSMFHSGKAVLFALTALAGLTALVWLGVLTTQAGGGTVDNEPPAGKSSGQDKVTPKSSSNPTLVGERTLRGRAVGVNGKPLPRAKLVVLADGKATDAGVTDSDGRFAITTPGGGYLVLVPSGLGCDFVRISQAGGEVELRAVLDQTIRGRLVDSKGRAMARMRVAATSVRVFPEDSADPFLLAWTKRHFLNPVPIGLKEISGVSASLFEATTDAAGRFEIRGVGAERIVGVRVSGPGIATTEQWIVNRKGFDPKPYNKPTADTVPKGFGNARHRLYLHGPEPVFEVEADKPIRGQVVDADTNVPRSNVEVSLGYDSLDPFRVEFRARTDVAGRFEICGARQAPFYMVQVASDPKTGYMAAQARATNKGGTDPLSINVKVKKGVVVTGRVIDKTTGKPVPATITVAVLAGNPQAKDYPELGTFSWSQAEPTREDGTFRVVAIPGPVLLISQVRGGLLERLKYHTPAGDPRYPNYFKASDGSMPVGFEGYGGVTGHVDGHGFHVLEIKPKVETVEQNLSVESMAGLPVKLRDSDGKPVTGAYAVGISPRTPWYPAIRLDNDTCPVYFLEPGTPRPMAFFDVKRNLAGSTTLVGTEKDPVVVTLKPTAKIKGKLVDEKGKPLSGIVVDVYYAETIVDEVHRAIPRMKAVASDATGAFEIDGLIPDEDIFLRFPGGKWSSQPPGQPLVVFERGTAGLKPGESVDKGEITLYPQEQQ